MWLAVAAILGAAAVSGVQVVVGRADAASADSPAALRDRSRCPHCATDLRARDVVPVLSFVLLRGRCWSCGSRIPRRHVVGEVAGAVAWALTAAVVGVGWWLPVMLVAPLVLALPILPPLRRAGPRWLLAALLPAAGAALLTLGVAGALFGDWALYVMAGLLGAGAMLTALVAVRLIGHSSLPEQMRTCPEPAGTG